LTGTQNILNLPYTPLLSHPCLLGEGPVWDVREERIYWVDIVRHEIHSCTGNGHDHRVINTGESVSAVALNSKGKLLAALQHGFAFIDLTDGSKEWINNPVEDVPGNRFNDGKCDPSGRFWAGTMNMQGAKNAGNVYTLETDGSASVKLKGVSVSNGMAWSPDGCYFYFIDTATREISAFDFDTVSGEIRNQRTVVQVPQEMGKPDGMTIDTEGMLWVALWDGWSISRWDPFTGALLCRIILPVAHISSCTFGGKDLRDIYVTSASLGLTDQQKKEQPLAGSVFVLRGTPFRGLPAIPFDGHSGKVV
jgi:sugar lactone lactonase YvrE